MIKIEEFVRLWQTSTSRKHLEERTGQSYDLLYQRAYTLKKKGVPLKEYPRERTAGTDYAALAKLAELLLPD